jgi:hypothetical protein
MSIAIIESFITSKSGREDDCEDAIVVTDAFVGVIDGATAKTDRRINGETPGRALARAIAERIKVLDPGIDCSRAIIEISRYCEQQLIVPNLGKLKTREKRPSAVLAMYSIERREIWRLGDCHYAIGDEQSIGEKLIDEVTSNARSAMLTAAILAGKSVTQLQREDVGRAFILPLLQKQSLFMNDRGAGEWAYGVIDGTPEAADFVEVRSVPAGSEVVLCSDGYPAPHRSLDAAEAARSSIVVADPMLFSAFKSTKGLMEGHVSFDDRAYVRFST